MEATTAITLELEEVRAVMFRAENGAEYLWDPYGISGLESHDPADRVGGPYGIDRICDEDTTYPEWYLFTPADSYFPSIWAACGRTEYDAYQELINDERVKAYLSIDAQDLADYGADTDEPTCSFADDGTPIDDEGVRLIGAVRIVRVWR